MNVQELIELLRLVSQEKQVMVEGCDCCGYAWNVIEYEDSVLIGQGNYAAVYGKFIQLLKPNK